MARAQRPVLLHRRRT